MPLIPSVDQPRGLSPLFSDPLEQQDGEHPNEFAWFLTYFDLGPGRSFLNAVRTYYEDADFTSVPGTWARAIDRWSWRARAESGDAERVMGLHRRRQAVDAFVAELATEQAVDYMQTVNEISRGAFLGEAPNSALQAAKLGLTIAGVDTAGTRKVDVAVSGGVEHTVATDDLARQMVQKLSRTAAGRDALLEIAQASRSLGVEHGDEALDVDFEEVAAEALIAVR